MSSLTLGAPAQVRQISLDVYEPGSPAYLLASMLDGLIEAERGRRRLEEEELRQKTPPHKPLVGLLGVIPREPAYIADSLPWYEILKDFLCLQAFAEAIGMAPSVMAEQIATLLAPPNWELFFWMSRALESATGEEAKRWRQEAIDARAEADALRKKAAARSKKATDSLWGREGGPRSQRQWWENAWAAAKAKTPGLTKKAFVAQQWSAYLATRPRPLVERETVQTKWLRGK